MAVKRPLFHNITRFGAFFASTSSQCRLSDYLFLSLTPQFKRAHHQVL